MTRSLLIRFIVFGILLVFCAIAYRATGDLPENSRLVWRIPIFVFGSALLAIAGMLFFLPAIGDRIADFFYSAPERVEPDAGAKARALVARGEYQAAIDAYLKLAADLPMERMPVVDAMRLAREKLHDFPQAIAILESALTGRDWPEEDAAFFLFRLVEIYEDDMADRTTAAEILHRIIQAFPATRHSANATHKLREWGIEPATPC